MHRTERQAVSAGATRVARRLADMHIVWSDQALCTAPLCGPLVPEKLRRSRSIVLQQPRHQGNRQPAIARHLSEGMQSMLHGKDIRFADDVR